MTLHDIHHNFVTLVDIIVPFQYIIIHNDSIISKNVTIQRNDLHQPGVIVTFDGNIIISYDIGAFSVTREKLTFLHSFWRVSIKHCHLQVVCFFHFVWGIVHYPWTALTRQSFLIFTIFLREQKSINFSINRIAILCESPKLLVKRCYIWTLIITPYNRIEQSDRIHHISDGPQ